MTAGDRPLVSVVTPVLNRVETMPHCLAAVRAQDHPNVEHIVVDGGSDDGTQELLEEAAAQSDSFRWISESDDGMYDAINKGMAMATGDILAYLNSDDLWFPWTLTTALDRLAAGADLAFGDLAIVTREGEHSRMWLQFYRDFNLPWYTYTTRLAQPTLVWDRSVAEDIGPFDDSYRLVGDCEYWLRAATAGKQLVHTGEVQAVQIEHGGTLRVTQSQRLRDELARLEDAYAEAAGDRANPRVQRAARSLLWRRDQWRFVSQCRRPQPTRWAAFIGFLRQRQLDVDLRKLVSFQLPDRFRPLDATWIDPARFEDELLEMIGS